MPNQSDQLGQLDQLDQSDNLNYAIEPNKYIEQLKNETDQEKKFNLLKKYFTESITKKLYQNMDLLYAMNVDFEQFKNMYVMISKDLFLNVLLAVDTLVTERKKYVLDTSKINITSSLVEID